MIAISRLVLLAMGLVSCLGCVHDNPVQESYQATIFHISVDDLADFEHALVEPGNDLVTLVDKYDQEEFSDFCGTASYGDSDVYLHDIVDVPDRSSGTVKPIEARITGYSEEQRLIGGKIIKVIHLKLRD